MNISWACEGIYLESYLDLDFCSTFSWVPRFLIVGSYCSHGTAGDPKSLKTVVNPVHPVSDIIGLSGKFMCSLRQALGSALQSFGL